MAYQPRIKGIDFRLSKMSSKWLYYDFYKDLLKSYRLRGILLVTNLRFWGFRGGPPKADTA